MIKNKLNRVHPYLIALVLTAGAIGLLHSFTRSESQSCSTDTNKEATAVSQTKGTTKMSNATSVSVADFDEQVLEAEEPVLVDFWAPWCMPCKMLSPTIDELASDYEGKAKVVKVNTDENQELAAKYGIRGIPTLIVFKDGEPVDRAVGVQPKSALSDKLDKAIGSDEK